jgi:hypothetical protein
MNRNESSSVCPNRIEVEGARVSTPGVVEQVCQVEKEKEKRAANASPGLLVEIKYMTTVQGDKCGFDWINKAKLAVSVNFRELAILLAATFICCNTKIEPRMASNLFENSKPSLSGDAIARRYGAVLYRYGSADSER